MRLGVRRRRPAPPPQSPALPLRCSTKPRPYARRRRRRSARDAGLESRDPALPRAEGDEALKRRALYARPRETCLCRSITNGAEGALSAMSDQGREGVPDIFEAFVARKEGGLGPGRGNSNAACPFRRPSPTIFSRVPTSVWTSSRAGDQCPRGGAQLSEIRARGGRQNTWAEAALAMALSGPVRQATDRAHSSAVNRRLARLGTRHARPETGCPRILPCPSLADLPDLPRPRSGGAGHGAGLRDPFKATEAAEEGGGDRSALNRPRGQGCRCGRLPDDVQLETRP